MIKKIIVFVLVMLFSIAYTMGQSNIFRVKDNEFMYNGTAIDLNNDIEKVCQDINLNYETEDIPGFIGYYFNDHRLNFYITEGSTKISSVMFQFYDTTDDFNFDLIIDDIIISTSTSWNDILDTLSSNGIGYTVKERKRNKSIKLINHRITSIKYNLDDLNRPYRIQFR